MISKIKNKIKRYLLNSEKAHQMSLSFSGKTNGAYLKELLSSSTANQLIGEKIKNNQPFLVSRLGATELKAVNNFLVKNCSSYQKWNPEIIEELYTHSGVFPRLETITEAFCKVYLNSMYKVDLFGVWNNLGENILIETIAPSASLCELIGIEPFFVKNPWSQYLKQKKILVIHPFKSSIEKQFKKRNQLFPNTQILPEFDLQVIEAVQSLSGGSNNGFQNWIEALDFMKSEIDKLSFDVAIIGAGAYGLPLAAYIKEKGKIVIHLGGATQLLFGIKGKRWIDREEYVKLFNVNWVFPFESEKPVHGNKADGIGPYWK